MRAKIILAGAVELAVLVATSVALSYVWTWLFPQPVALAVSIIGGFLLGFFGHGVLLDRVRGVYNQAG